MKAIGIKIVDLQPMYVGEAQYKGYKTNNCEGNHDGYEVTYPDGYKSWCPKNIADKTYFKLDVNNDGTKILEQDLENFISSHQTSIIGSKTTVVLATTIIGFDMINASTFVDPKNYSQELGEKYALKTIKSNLRSYLSFVLQWAKNGIYNK